MTLSRYAAFDSYTHQQLWRDFAASTPKEQIKLIEGFCDESEFKGNLRDAIVQWVVTEGPLEVCQWVARNLYLSDDEAIKLRNNSDDFTKACLWEGPAFCASSLSWPDEKVIETFKEVSHLEQLAMVRNPRISPKLIELVFDWNDESLEITKEARYEFLKAILSNRGALEPPSFSQQRAEHFAKLWRLMNTWPGPASEVYRHVPVDSETKVDAYQAATDPYVRQSILLNDAPEFDKDGFRTHEASKVLELGLNDEDEGCRRIAIQRNADKNPHVDPRAAHRQTTNQKAARLLAISGVVLGVLIVSVAIALFSLTNSGFEGVVVSLFILVFIHLRSIASRMDEMAQEMQIQMQRIQLTQLEADQASGALDAKIALEELEELLHLSQTGLAARVQTIETTILVLIALGVIFLALLK